MAKKSSGRLPVVVVQSKLKELVKKSKLKCASDVIDAANALLAEHVAKGCARARANGRKTLRGTDL